MKPSNGSSFSVKAGVASAFCSKQGLIIHVARSTSRLFQNMYLQTFNSKVSGAGTFKGAMIDRDALDDSDQSLGLRNVKIVDWFLWGAKMRYMTERVKKEKEQNINHSRSTDPVAFGQVIQLRHLKTGKFVGRLRAGGRG